LQSAQYYQPESVIGSMPAGAFRQVQSDTRKRFIKATQVEDVCARGAVMDIKKSTSLSLFVRLRLQDLLQEWRTSATEQQLGIRVLSCLSILLHRPDQRTWDSQAPDRNPYWLGLHSAQ
jgi:hypothetical protein